MSLILTPEIHSTAARAIGLSPFATLLPTDIPFIVSHLRLEVTWVHDLWVAVRVANGPGHVEHVGVDSERALFTAVVMCAALVGGAGR